MKNEKKIVSIGVILGMLVVISPTILAGYEECYYCDGTGDCHCCDGSGYAYGGDCPCCDYGICEACGGSGYEYVSDGGSGSSGSSLNDGCFIATAAFGTDIVMELDILRSFRDNILLTTKPGDLLVNTYYSTSPPHTSTHTSFIVYHLFLDYN